MRTPFTVTSHSSAEPAPGAVLHVMTLWPGVCTVHPDAAKDRPRPASPPPPPPIGPTRLRLKYSTCKRAFVYGVAGPKLLPVNTIVALPEVGPMLAPGPENADTEGGAYASGVGKAALDTPATLTCQKWFAPEPGGVIHVITPFESVPVGGDVTEQPLATNVHTPATAPNWTDSDDAGVLTGPKPLPEMVTISPPAVLPKDPAVDPVIEEMTGPVYDRPSPSALAPLVETEGVPAMATVTGRFTPTPGAVRHRMVVREPGGKKAQPTPPYTPLFPVPPLPLGTP